jgi:hypothetical protein
MMDKYTQLCTILMTLQVIEAAVVGMLSYMYERNAADELTSAEDSAYFFFDVRRHLHPGVTYNWPAMFDSVAFAVLLLLFLGGHVWFGVRLRQLFIGRGIIPPHKTVVEDHRRNQLTHTHKAIFAPNASQRAANERRLTENEDDEADGSPSPSGMGSSRLAPRLSTFRRQRSLRRSPAGKVAKGEPNGAPPARIQPN